MTNSRRSPTGKLRFTGMFTTVISALLAVGCSSDLPTYPVSGKVLFTDGSPVKVGTVELKSREHPIQARGKIDTDGTFQLTTYNENDGAVAGVHDCVIVQFVMAEDVTGHRPSTIGVVGRRYASYTTSGLTLEITGDGENEVVLEVEGILKEQPDSHTHR